MIELPLIISYPTVARVEEFLNIKRIRPLKLRVRLSYWDNRSYTLMAKPMNTLELYYPMIQFLIMQNRSHHQGKKIGH